MHAHGPPPRISQLVCSDARLEDAAGCGLPASGLVMDLVAREAAAAARADDADGDASAAARVELRLIVC